MEPKAPWTKPTVKAFSPDAILEEIAEEAEKARLAALPKAPPPLHTDALDLLSSFAQKRDRMDGLKVLDQRANMARASALLRAEAWRKFDTGELRLDQPSGSAGAKQGDSYWDPNGRG